MDRLVLPSRLENSHRVLIAGAGGGFDVYAGLPIYEHLRLVGKRVFLSNLSFTQLRATGAKEVHPTLFEVGMNTRGEDRYFPERSLARFLTQRLQEFTTIYAIENLGARPVREAYAHLVAKLEIDAVVLVDGGTDILLRGDEASLGTPAEDAVSLAAFHSLMVPTKVLACVGFGVDRYHGVCHAHWLENAGALTASGAFLGAMALIPQMPEVRLYLDAVEHAARETPGRESIVNSSIAAAIQGEFGDTHPTTRTLSSELFLSALMAILWAFDLDAVAERNLYLDALNDTETNRDVQLAIEAFQATVRSRPRGAIPY